MDDINGFCGLVIIFIFTYDTIIISTIVGQLYIEWSLMGRSVTPLPFSWNQAMTV
uniref:Uncharacterized protein n=1 Tax=Aegilops tauschii subsp. strangulata TaxID=200361 RepID=A0A453E6J8_AEGTS